VQLIVTVYGGAAGNKTITDFNDYQIPSFTNVAALFGYYDPDKAGSVVQRTLDLRDSSGATTSCTFSETVLAGPPSPWGPPPSLVGCSIRIAEASLSPGQTAHFTFTGTNASSVTFSDFFPSSSWQIADSDLQAVSATEAQAEVTYEYPGLKTATIAVSDGTSWNTCGIQFYVGPQQVAIEQSPPGPTKLNGEFNLAAQATGVTNPGAVTYHFASTDATLQIVSTGPNTARVRSTAGTNDMGTVTVTASGPGVSITGSTTLTFEVSPPADPFVGCNVLVAPVSYGAQTDAPVLLGSVARVQAFPQGGVGPFSAQVVSVTQFGAGFPYTLATDVASGDTQTVNLRFSNYGTPLVEVRLTDESSGVFQDCSTYAISN
jgi:hypothetical protein